MSRSAVRLAISVLAVLAAAGSAGASGPALAAAARPPAHEPVLRAAATGQSRTPWPERVLMTENGYLARATQVLDPTRGLLYALVPQRLPAVSGPWVLQALRLRGGGSRSGGTYLVSGLALTGGFVWAYGVTAAGHDLIAQIDPRTLGTIRTENVGSGYPGVAGVAAGLPGSVWTGSGRSLRRLSVWTGAVLARAMLPAGFVLDQVAAAPGGTVLYASAVRVNAGGCVLFEYSALTGRLLARRAGAPLSSSIAGATLTALPGGVWASFRTGRRGQSVLLSQHGLAVIARAPGSARPGPYEWPVSSSAVYGGGTLWLTTGAGLLACLNPATGAVRAAQTLVPRVARLWELLTADPARRLLYGLTPGSQALAETVPPSRCWH